MKLRILKISGAILIFMGLAVIIYALASNMLVERKSNEMVEEYSAYINWIQESEIPQEDINQINNQQENTEDEDTFPELAEGLIGIMEIDKIDLSVTIAEGTDNKSITLSVGHFTNTAMPGEMGNFAVVGHRSYRYGAYFNRLDELEAGDLIKVRTKDGDFTYVVDDKYVVEPTELQVLEPTEDATITLVTCTPIKTATHRLIIKGHLI